MLFRSWHETQRRASLEHLSDHADGAHLEPFAQRSAHPATEVQHALDLGHEREHCGSLDLGQRRGRDDARIRAIPEHQLCEPLTSSATDQRLHRGRALAKRDGRIPERGSPVVARALPPTTQALQTPVAIALAQRAELAIERGEIGRGRDRITG